MSEDISLEQFIKLSIISKDIGLIVVTTDGEIDLEAKTLNEKGFVKSENTDDFSNNKKSYYILSKDIPKEMYDFMAQYSSGHIEIFDTEKMESKVVNPEYKNSAVILISTKQNLSSLETKGLNIRQIVGPVWQS